MFFPAAKALCVHFAHLQGLHPHCTLFLNKSPLPFSPSVKFNGHFLDCEAL
jgi:hypothetical protein